MNPFCRRPRHTHREPPGVLPFDYGGSSYGTIGLVRSTEVPAPTISVSAWFACWQMYSKSSVPACHRRFDVPVNGAV